MHILMLILINILSFCFFIDFFEPKTCDTNVVFILHLLLGYFGFIQWFINISDINYKFLNLLILILLKMCFSLRFNVYNVYGTWKAE